MGLVVSEVVAQRCSVKKSLRKNFAKFTGKQLGLRPATLLKKRLWHRFFPVNFFKFHFCFFLQNTFGGCFCYFGIVANIVCDYYFEYVIVWKEV